MSSLTSALLDSALPPEQKILAALLLSESDHEGNSRVPLVAIQQATSLTPRKLPAALKELQRVSFLSSYDVLLNGKAELHLGPELTAVIDKAQLFSPSLTSQILPPTNGVFVGETVVVSSREGSADRARGRTRALARSGLREGSSERAGERDEGRDKGVDTPPSCTAASSAKKFQFQKPAEKAKQALSENRLPKSGTNAYWESWRDGVRQIVKGAFVGAKIKPTFTTSMWGVYRAIHKEDNLQCEARDLFLTWLRTWGHRAMQTARWTRFLVPSKQERKWQAQDGDLRAEEAFQAYMVHRNTMNPDQIELLELYEKHFADEIKRYGFSGYPRVCESLQYATQNSTHSALSYALAHPDKCTKGRSLFAVLDSATDTYQSAMRAGYLRTNEEVTDDLWQKLKRDEIERNHPNAYKDSIGPDAELDEYFETMPNGKVRIKSEYRK